MRYILFLNGASLRGRATKKMDPPVSAGKVRGPQYVCEGVANSTLGACLLIQALALMLVCHSPQTPWVMPLTANSPRG